jgi:hypothetical protein
VTACVLAVLWAAAFSLGRFFGGGAASQKPKSLAERVLAPVTSIIGLLALPIMVFLADASSCTMALLGILYALSLMCFAASNFSYWNAALHDEELEWRLRFAAFI